MGRRPNPLVLEFFERGRKIDDNSNRYEQTCRKCRETFPKGRADVLLGHILRRCPRATEVDRDAVLVYLQKQKASPKHVRGLEQIDGDGFSALQQQSNTLVDPPNYIDFSNSPDLLILASQQQSALDTLAEVSRHHLDYSEFHRTSFGGDQAFNESDQGHALAEQAFAAQLQQATNESQDAPVAIDTVPNTVADGGSLHPGNKISDTSTSCPDLVPDPGRSQQPNFATSAIDPELHSPTPGLLGAASNAEYDRVEMASAAIATPTSGSASDHQLSDRPMPGFASPVRSTKGRVRGRFTDTRRKEVSDLRKRGACIRCRMLKKSCSEGTPCNSCSHLESARIWKAKCLRTRLADECSLWSARVFHAKSAIASPAASGTVLSSGVMDGEVDHHLTKTENPVLRFHARVLQFDGMTDNLAPSYSAFESRARVLIEEKNMPEKLSPHLLGLADGLVESEKEPLIRGTLKRAIRHAQEESAVSPTPNTHQKTRSCYSLGENLVRASIELWTATSLLCGKQDLTITAPLIRSNASPLASDKTQTATETAHLQTYAALETLCATLAKNVVNALERRLMQRQQASRLATLLSTILLLHAMARMRALYQRFEAQDSRTPTDGFRQWPLDVPPSKLCAQAEQLADILVNLLQMRALPPECKTSPEGSLVVATSFVQMGRRVFDNSMLPPENQSSLLSDWLDPLKVDVGLLVAAKNGTDYDGVDRAELEELRHIARLLLPMELKR